MSSAVGDFSGPCPENGYYDVFLSFRGSDTRYGFTANLYQSLKNNKIYSFMDIKNLGYDINRLFEMVTMSKVALVVYSENFASSAWCLKELKMILQRRGEKKMLIIPIFYNIDVDELKHLIGKTGKYLDGHIQKHGETTVKEWKTAVITLGHISGLSYKNTHGRYEFEFIAEVIAKTKEKLEEWEQIVQSTSKPYNSGPATEYDVFISFMGEDTRYSLVNHLYRELKIRKVMKTFMDDQDLLKDDSVFEVIQQSKMAVVVFSENYASSKWCLRELVKILQCRNNKMRQLVVLPIFYEITPRDFIKQAATKASMIACQLEEHVLDEEEITVQSWRDAITELGNMDGWPYSTAHSKRELAEFIRGLVEEILNILNRLDEKKESTRNQQACVSAKEENTQALAVQTNTSGPRSGVSEECPVMYREVLADGSFDNAEIEEVGVSEMDTALKRVEEEVLSSNDKQQQADEIDKDLACDKNIEKGLKVPQEDKFSSTSEEEVYRIVTSAYFQKSATSITGELIRIEPCYLIFYVEPEKPSSSWLTLANNTDKHMAFLLKMDTKKQLNYSINPNKGVLLPRSRCQVQVTMEAQTVLSSHEESEDILLIQCVKVKKDSYSMNGFNSNMFTEKSRNAIEEFEVPVLYVARPPRRDSSVPNPLGQLLANKGLIHDCMYVASIDTHPTKPWILLGLYHGFVSIWNYETRAEEKLFKADDDGGAAYAKFIHEKHWIVVGAFNQVKVFDYNTLEKVKVFKPHGDFLRCISFHQTSPYVLTGSIDGLIKLWNCENDWACNEWQSSGVVDVGFNAKDTKSFASLHDDGNIKIWSCGSSVAKFTINAHNEKVTCVEYFVGNDNKLYLLSGSSDNTARVWDYESKTLVQTLEGHSDVVTITLVHPKLPIIITGSLDKTIRIWNKDTHWLELVWSCDLGAVFHIGFIQASDEVVLGCEDGMVMIKIVDAAGTQSD